MLNYHTADGKLKKKKKRKVPAKGSAHSLTSDIWNIEASETQLEEYYEMMSALSVIQDLKIPAAAFMNEWALPAPWYYFILFFYFFGPLWNLNVCRDQSHPAGGRGGAISRNPPYCSHTAAVPLLLLYPGRRLPFWGVLPRAATRGQECSGVFFFFSSPFLPPHLSSSCLLLSCLSVCSRANADTCAELHVIMNIDFLWEKK